jgi:hypothetical protein
LAGADNPEHLLARQPPPPHVGEGPFALWHFSEDPALHRFRPHLPATNPGAAPHVWAVDTRHAPIFWFPRDCPRGCIWPVSTTTPEDREQFFGQSAATRIHVMESGWLERARACRLYAYRLPVQAFHRQRSSSAAADSAWAAEIRSSTPSARSHRQHRRSVAAVSVAIAALVLAISTMVARYCGHGDNAAYRELSAGLNGHDGPPP